MRDWVLKSTKEVKSVNAFTGMGHQKSKSFATMSKTMSKIPSNNLSLNLSNMHTQEPMETEVRDPFSTFEPSIKQR